DAELRERDRRFAAGQSKFSAAALAAKRMMYNFDSAEGAAAAGGGGGGHDRDAIGGWQKDVSMAQIRRPSSPPMHGEDITFVRCQSPVSMICESESDVSASHDGGPESKQDGYGLWTADRAADKNINGGLWNGTCRRPS